MNITNGDQFTEANIVGMTPIYDNDKFMFYGYNYKYADGTCHPLKYLSSWGILQNAVMDDKHLYLKFSEEGPHFEKFVDDINNLGNNFANIYKEAYLCSNKKYKPVANKNVDNAINLDAVQIDIDFKDDNEDELMVAVDTAVLPKKSNYKPKSEKKFDAESTPTDTKTPSKDKDININTTLVDTKFDDPVKSLIKKMLVVQYGKMRQLTGIKGDSLTKYKNDESIKYDEYKKLLNYYFRRRYNNLYAVRDFIANADQTVLSSFYKSNYVIQTLPFQNKKNSKAKPRKNIWVSDKNKGDYYQFGFNLTDANHYIRKLKIYNYNISDKYGYKKTELIYDAKRFSIVCKEGKKIRLLIKPVMWLNKENGYHGVTINITTMEIKYKSDNSESIIDRHEVRSLISGRNIKISI
jgi:hypothetical protein